MFSPSIRMCLSAFILDFAVVIALTATPFYVFNQIGGGAGMSGTFGAAQAVAYTIGCLFSALIASRSRNPMNWAIAGVLFFSIMFALMPLSRNPWICGAFQTLANFALALPWPVMHSWMGAHPDPAIRARNMSWFNISWSFGFAVSPLFAGPLYDHRYWMPFLAVLIVNFITLALMRSIPHERDYYSAPSDEMMAARAGHDRRSEQFLYAAWWATLVANAFIGVTRAVLPKRVDELVATGQLRLLWENIPADFLLTNPATKFSWIAFASAFTTAITFLIMGRTTRWHHRFGFIFVMQAGAAAAFWEIGHTHSLIIMILSGVLVGACVGVSFFSSVFYCMGDPARKHRRASINEGAVGTGSFLGSLFFGYAAARWGISMPFHTTPVLIAAAFVIQLALLRLGTRQAQKIAA